ncbi:MAG: NgoFVII family restriction endonuclease [Firmicutes bacterium HGW-Firmicutes-15]|nr:MAG: NgoFVII family restriction endonuclease [Firmicutes bacterium HGW-Firmicutes-15]
MLQFGLYEQVINQIINQHLDRINNEMTRIQTSPIDSAESSKILAEYLALLIRDVLDYIEGENEAVDNRISLCNSLIEHIATVIEKGERGFRHNRELALMVRNHIIHQDAKLLLALVDKKKSIIRPDTSIAENSLFTGATHEPSMVSELKKEILSCDRIELLVSFIKWSGLRLILDELKEFTYRGGSLRVITTSYLGATDFKAVEKLSSLPNTEIRISYDTERTRLHAKTYVFWRDSGFSSAYIGSSNISESAMTSGLEWNIKLSEYDSKDILKKIQATFESYWYSREFINFVPELDSDRLRKALKSERYNAQEEDGKFAFNFDITPYYFQQEILDKLKAEREIHNSYRNLVIAATGTGKTVVAAFDYKRFIQENPGKLNRLLFVAHRKEILQQSRDCFRAILKDYNFGSLMVGGSYADSLDHLFVSIQSLNSKELTTIAAPDYYDFIIIDEFHHAAAPSYEDLLEYYQPRVLLGLTATPERPDGKDVFQYFNGRIAAELRLNEAIERKLLSSFHYFCVTDTVSLQNVRWSAGKYDQKQLDNLFVFEAAQAERRVSNIVQAIDRYCGDLSDIIGIGFCVSKEHARYMADNFNQAGIAADYLVAESEESLRSTVKQRLVKKEINFIFVVDLYNEGVDIPEINTVLFLRPTESLTVFIQQLGRGLRLCEGKEALTVLDFVGQANRKFNFEERFRALLARTRRTVEYEIEHGFIHTPRGCSIQMERQAQEYILENIKNTINNKRNIKLKLRDYMQIHAGIDANEFFASYHVQPKDLYSKRCTLGSLASEAGLVDKYPENDLYVRMFANAFLRLSGANSRRWIKFLLDILPKIKLKHSHMGEAITGVERTMLTMLHYTVYSKGLDDLDTTFANMEEAIYAVIKDDLTYNELMGLLQYQYERIEFVDKPLDLDFECPLDLYCSYTLDQILVALGRHTERKRKHFQEGVLYLPDKGLDVFFVTLNKSDKDYSPSTMYRDYAINEEQFHWQSQSITSVESATGQRYINQQRNGNRVLIFVRDYKKEGQAAVPYTCIGLADYVSHYGSAPLSIVWKMREPMPGFVLKEAVTV